MTDERYVVRVNRLADAQSAHSPVWRSRYDGPYTGIGDDPEFAEFAAAAYAVHGSDGTGIWQGGEGLARRLHDAWGAFAATGDPGWDRYTVPDRRTMIFDPAGPHVETDPFAAVRAGWDGLDWQPGTWWRYDGVT
jgi:para-nitrobenzyl esterase